MDKEFEIEGEKVHAMCVVGDTVYVADEKTVYSFHVAPKTVWEHIKDFFIKSK